MVEMENGGGLRLFLLDLLFPNRCPFCDGFINYKKLCCDECLGDITWADDKICKVCGKLLYKSCTCGQNKNYDICVPAAYYIGKAREGVLSFKFHKGLNAAEVFGRVLRERLSDRGLLDEIDIAVPVPMEKRHQRKRGYNQAELLARVIVRDTGIPLRTDILTRTNVKHSQHTLGAEERHEAVKHQFSASENVRLDGKTVLLTDDVITTGSTLDYCAGLLKGKGAYKVICAVCTTA